MRQNGENSAPEAPMPNAGGPGVVEPGFLISPRIIKIQKTPGKRKLLLPRDQ